MASASLLTSLIIPSVLITCVGAVIRLLTRSSVRKEDFRLIVWKYCPSQWGKWIGDDPIYSDGKMRLLG